MAYMVRLQAIADELNEQYFEENRASETAREQETRAVTKLQAAARGFLVRLTLRRLAKTVLTIQRHWRAYLGRRRYDVVLNAHLKKLRKQYFDAQATQIQRHWRGYYSRARVHDFYARKAWLAAVKRKNLETQAWLQDEFVRSVAVQKADALAQARATFDAKVENLHHLVSTHAQPGVFNSPFNAVTGTLPTVAGLPLEDHLRLASQRTRKLPPVKLKPGMHSSGSAKRKTSRTRLTINAASEYEAVREAKNMEHVLNKSEVLAHHAVDFKSMVRPVEPYLLTQSRRNTERYHDPYDPTIGIRNERVDDGMKSISPGPLPSDARFKKFWRKQDVFDDTI